MITNLAYFFKKILPTTYNSLHSLILLIQLHQIYHTMNVNNYNFITDPESGELVNVNSSGGRLILHKYLLQITNIQEGNQNDTIHTHTHVHTHTTPTNTHTHTHTHIHTNIPENVSPQESVVSTGNTFKFHGRHFKKHAAEHITYQGSYVGRPQLTKYLEKKIAQMEEIVHDKFGLHFDQCIIVKKPWKRIGRRWNAATGGFECGVIESGVALNYTFVTNDGSIMWRKRGDSHGTINKVYTKNSSIHYTHWMRNPSI